MAEKSWRTVQLHGGAPWGFRISETNNLTQPGLSVSKVRTRSKAYTAGLRDNDSIIFINNIPTHSMKLQEASELIESLDNLTLTVANSLALRRDSETKYTVVIDNNSNSNNNNSSVSNKERFKTFKSNLSFDNDQNNNQVTKNHINLTNKVATMNNGNQRVLSNPSFNRFANYNQTYNSSPSISVNRQLQNSQSYSSSRREYPLQQQRHQNSKKSYHENSRRNYYSATESCGEETDNDSVFGFEIKPKQSYASISLRSPLKDVNYFSDTETTNTSRNYYKVRQQQQQQQQHPRQYNPPQFLSHSVPQQSSSSLRASSSNNQMPYYQPSSNIQPSAVHNQQSNQIPVNKGSFSLLGKTNTKRELPTENPYSPSPHVFKVPNIYEKLNMPKQQSKPQNFAPYFAPSTPVEQPYIDVYDSSNSQHNAFNYEDEERKRYEAEMGAELVKPTQKQNYSDSYFYNSPFVNYPTIDDQKKLAKTIAATLEGSDPDRSKYHKYKKRQEHDEMSLEEQYYAQSHPESYITTPMKSPGYNAFVYDENIPEIIRKSIEQAEMYDPVRMVQAPEHLKQLHYTEHNTHTEMPPQAAMSLAAALHQAGGRGAEIFQKRKAKSEKWVVDDSNVKSPVPTSASFFSPQPVYDNVKSMSKLAPLVRKEPVIVSPIVPVKNEENHQRFSDFNSKPKGWNTGEDYSAKERKQINLAIDQSIREGIQELHFRNDSIVQRSPSPSLNRQTRNESPSVQEQSNYNRLLASQPNRIDLSNWVSQRDQNINNSKSYNISKDGIQNLRQKFYSNVQNVDNNRPMYGNYETMKFNDNNFSTPKPVISKVKLNRLNTNEFLTNSGNNAYQTSNDQQYSNRNYYDEDVAASDL